MVTTKPFIIAKKIKDSEALMEAAKNAHENELIYFVTVLRDDNPYCFIEINKGFYRVCFLDEFQRKYLSYDFTDRFNQDKSNELFLSQIFFWEFRDKLDEMTKITIYNFKPDGLLHITERDLIKNEQLDREAKEKIDVSANWEEYAEFGKYDSIIRKERDLKMNSI